MFFRRCDIFSVRSQRSAPRYAVADLQRFDLRADRRHHACAFLSRNEWQRRPQTSVAELAVDGIHSRDGDLHHCFVGPSAGEWEPRPVPSLPARQFAARELLSCWSLGRHPEAGFCGRRIYALVGSAELPLHRAFAAKLRLRISKRYGISSNFPVVFLPSRSRCARCASASGYVCSIRSFSVAGGNHAEHSARPRASILRAWRCSVPAWAA